MLTVPTGIMRTEARIAAAAQRRTNLSKPGPHDIALLVGRLALAGLLVKFHGAARLLKAVDYLAGRDGWPFVELVAGLGFPFPAAFAIASALAESLGALLLGGGWWTRAAASAIVVNMSVALYSEAIKDDPMELPGLYLAAALVYAIGGAGRYSLDAWRRPS
jgi:putative oxidoreductase